MNQQAGYRRLHQSGELERRVRRAEELLTSCVLCPRRCGVHRLRGETGFCGLGSDPVISSIGPHFGEESPLVGWRGSGTIFLAGCNLGCIFCQNYDISHLRRGRISSPEGLAEGMLLLQSMGCHNINMVTPTHFVPQILRALVVAADRGLTLPVVYNCGGYESIETLEILDGVVDIYMPDFKYGQNDVAQRYSHASDYVEMAKESLREMHRQVGDLRIDERGIAVGGLLIRHLVLPHGLAGTERVMEFIAGELSRDSYVNIMDQYRPEFKAMDYQELSRRITGQEYHHALQAAKTFGLWRFSS